jgi:hypothetical protein
MNVTSLADFADPFVRSASKNETAINVHETRIVGYYVLTQLNTIWNRQAPRVKFIHRMFSLTVFFATC